ncbi:MAG TPA: molybdenum cofactor guanylyltransferase [Gemmatimonadales bacterium]|nr:molybdenum cofactor guanylyltransferase [Gemmatimonadales bacterium]
MTDARTHQGPRGVILAGGGATRFEGRPKGLERVGGVRILDRLVATFTEALGEAPLLIANAPEAEGWRPGLEVHRDVRPGAGALGGLLSALTAAGGRGVVVAAWDMPFVPAGLLRELAEGLGRHDACLPESEGRRGLEPMLAAYGPGCLAPIAAALDRGDRRAVAFHDAVRVGILPLERVRRYGDPARLFFNVNTADDLAAAEAAWQALGSSRS